MLAMQLFNIQLVTFVTCHLSLTGDDKGEESKAAIVKKLSDARNAAV
jgi:hypothetical protein